MVHLLKEDESEERKPSEFSSLVKTQRDFVSLYRTLNKITEMERLTKIVVFLLFWAVYFIMRFQK